MTETQATEMLAILADLRFYAVTVCLGVGLVWGAIMWRLTVLAKNQKHLW